VRKKAPKADKQLDELRELVIGSEGEEDSHRKTDRRGILSTEPSPVSRLPRL